MIHWFLETVEFLGLSSSSPRYLPPLICCNAKACLVRTSMIMACPASNAALASATATRGTSASLAGSLMVGVGTAGTACVDSAVDCGVCGLVGIGVNVIDGALQADRTKIKVTARKRILDLDISF